MVIAENGLVEERPPLRVSLARRGRGVLELADLRMSFSSDGAVGISAQDLAAALEGDLEEDTIIWFRHDPSQLSPASEQINTKNETSTDLIDLGNERLIDPNLETAIVYGRERHFSETERKLLAKFLDNPNTLISTTELLREVWGQGQNTRLVKLAILRLRRKLGDVDQTLICARKDKGYYLHAPALMEKDDEGDDEYSSLHEAELMPGFVLDYNLLAVEVNNKTIALSQKEFDLLELLFHNRNKFLSAEDIFKKVWGEDVAHRSSGGADRNNVRVHIYRLRKKLPRDYRELIVAKPEEGYGLFDDEAAERAYED